MSTIDINFLSIYINLSLKICYENVVNITLLKKKKDKLFLNIWFCYKHKEGFWITFSIFFLIQLEREPVNLG